MPWHERKLVGELENRTVRTEQEKLPRAGKFLPQQPARSAARTIPGTGCQKGSHSAVKRSHLTTNQEGVGKTVQWWFGSRSTGLTPRFHAE